MLPGPARLGDDCIQLGWLKGALMLFAAERWRTYTADPERTYRALTAPGATTLVAIDKGVVAGLVQLQSDSEIQAHLSALITGAQVAATRTRAGTGAGSARAPAVSVLTS